MGAWATVHEAVVSISHGYHGISVMRRLLGLGYENAVISGMQFASPMMHGPYAPDAYREGKPVNARRDVYWFNFGDRLGVIDFTQAQYYDWIRRVHIQVRGTHGEMLDEQVSYTKQGKTLQREIVTRVTEGTPPYLLGYQAGGKWLYKNPYRTPGLSDDGIAIAEMLTPHGHLRPHRQGLLPAGRRQPGSLPLLPGPTSHVYRPTGDIGNATVGGIAGREFGEVIVGEFQHSRIRQRNVGTETIASRRRP